MSYSGAMEAKQAREILGRALASLQVDPNMPADAQDVAAFMAQSVGSLFAAENAPNDVDGRAAVRASLGLLGQALAKMQMIQPPLAAVENAMGILAQTMGILFPLTTGPEPVAPVSHAAHAAPVSHAAQTASPAPAQQSLPASAAKSTLLFAEIPDSAQPMRPQPAAHAPQPAAIVQPAAAQPAHQPQAAFQPQPVQAAPAPTAPAVAPAALGAIPNPMGVPAATGQPAMGYGAPMVQPTWHETVPTPAPHVVPAALLAASMPDQPALKPLGHAEPLNAHAAGAAAPQGTVAPVVSAPVAEPPSSVDGRPVFEANIGVRTETNFWVGFEDDIGQGGVFMPTYEDFVPGSRIALRVTLPKGASFVAPAEVRFLRNAVEIGDPHPPGVGFRFEGLGAEQRELARQFMQRRRPLFYDVS